MSIRPTTEAKTGTCPFCGRSGLKTRPAPANNNALGMVVAGHNDKVGVFAWSLNSRCPGSLHESMESRKERLAR